MLASQLLGVNWALVEQVGEERDAALAREEAMRKERDAALAYLVRGKNEDGLEIMLRVASKDGEVAVVRRVLAAEDADVDAVDEHECTALMYATSYNREEVVRTLLEAGAAPNKRDANDWTALHCPCTPLPVAYPSRGCCSRRAPTPACATTTARRRWTSSSARPCTGAGHQRCKRATRPSRALSGSGRRSRSSEVETGSRP